MDALHAEALSKRAPFGERAAQAGGEPRVRALDHGRGDEIGRDPTETHEAPAYRGRCVLHGYPSLSLRQKAFLRLSSCYCALPHFLADAIPPLDGLDRNPAQLRSPRTCTPTASCTVSPGA